MTTYYFISDIHFSTDSDLKNSEKFRKLVSFFNYIKQPENELFIVGDLFDFWFEYKHVVPSKPFPILFELAKLIDAGVKVHFQRGNHDCWLRNFLSRELSIIVHDDEFTTKLNSNNVYLFHGDGIAKRDKGYRFLKKIFRNRLNIFFYRWLHPDIGIPLAKFMSHSSRQHTSKQIFENTDEYMAFVQDKFRSGIDCVILGHTHQPALTKFGNKILINLGDWLQNFSYGVLEGTNFSLNYWNS